MKLLPFLWIAAVSALLITVFTRPSQTWAQSVTERNLVQRASVSTDGSEQVTSVIYDLFEATDALEWDRVENLFADTVRLDYSSLTGQEPALLAWLDIVAWREARLPWFGVVLHQIQQPTVVVYGDTATASHRWLAIEYVETDEWQLYWTVWGVYEYILARTNDGWKIQTMMFDAKYEDGTREVLDIAAERVASWESTPEYTLDATNAAILEQYFVWLESLDPEAVSSTFADDVEQVMPFAPNYFPDYLRGDAVRAQYASLPSAFTSMNFERTYAPTADENVIVARYEWTIENNDGSFYNNIYVARFEFEDGRIQKITEYFDPEILDNGFNFSDRNIMPMLVQDYQDLANYERVTFESNGNTLVWDLYLPENFDASQQYPAVVVNGSWTSIKEQMPGLYASQYADQWFVALAFDHSGWWESEWEPRFVESPERKAQDIIAASEYIRTLLFIDQSRVNGVWICASAWYISDAWIEWAAFDRIALIAPWLHNEEIVNQLYGWEEGVQWLIAQWDEARAQYEQTWEPVLIPWASASNPESALMADYDYYANSGRGLIEAYDNQFNVQSWEGWLTYDPVSRSNEVTIPTKLIHSLNAAVPQGAQEYASSLPVESELLLLENASQDDFYDNMDYINVAVQESVAWFE